MSAYQRTAIRHVEISRYRSIDTLQLRDLPDTIVLFGPNGTGKSNVMRAIRLALVAASVPRQGLLPTSLVESVPLSFADANRLLDLRQDDVRHNSLPEIRVGVTINLGERAWGLLGTSAPKQLDLQIVVQNEGNQFRYWYERAALDDVKLAVPDSSSANISPQIANIRNNLPSLIAARDGALMQLDSAGSSLRAQISGQVQQYEQQIRAQQKAIQDLERRLSKEHLLAERCLNVLLPSLVQATDAYRVPNSKGDPQLALYQSFLSEDPLERAAVHRLGQQLARAGLFDTNDTVALVPVDSRTYGEKMVMFRHPLQGDLPLRNLGSGEQQLVFLLAQQLVTPSPIAFLEEPEAHLHKLLMEKLSRLLLASVRGDSLTRPAVDQLWIATHHHLFAIDEDFLDVSLDSKGATRIERKKRDEAAKHFYEPGPFWETLRASVASGMSPETALSVGREGQIVTVGDVLRSIDGDRVLANEFVTAATEAFVLSLTKGTAEA